MKTHTKSNGLTLVVLSLGLILGLILALPAHAALQSRLNGQAVYDTDLNITWLTNANLMASNTFGLDYYESYGSDNQFKGLHDYDQCVIEHRGKATWCGAQTWIGAMNNANHLGYNDWRLPTVSPINGSTFTINALDYDGTSDIGLNVSAPGTSNAGGKGSEMAYLFYNELGNKAYLDVSGNYIDQSDWGVTNSGPFQNLQNSDYWSGTVFAPAPNNAWMFDTQSGYQTIFQREFASYAMVVRSGDVAAPVPEVDAYALMALGMGLVGWLARRKQQSA